MKNLFYFLLGICFTIVTMSMCHSYDEKSSESVEEEPNIQYFDVAIKKKEIQLYTSMPKDSVRTLMGKPDNIDVFQSGSSIMETWEYLGNNRYINEFSISFVNGKLVSFSQQNEPM